MGKVATALNWVAGCVGTLLLAAAATKPDDAISNVAGWAELLGFSTLANLLTPSADGWAVAVGVLLIGFPAALWFKRRFVKPPVGFVRLEQATDTPKLKYTALRLVIRNNTKQNLTGLVATLIRVEPPLKAFPTQFHLPLTLATKTRIDKLRDQSQPLPAAPFNLNAGAEKQIEVLWLYSDGALEAHTTHEAGEAEYLFFETHTFFVEISGSGQPVVAGVKIAVIDEETGAWHATLEREISTA
jgi:hypothetical protein